MQNAAFGSHVHGCILLQAIEELCDEAPFGRLKCHYSHALCASFGLQAHRAGTHEFAEMREVIICPGISDLVGLFINDDHWMLDIWIWIAVNRGDCPRPAGLIENCIPV